MAKMNLFMSRIVRLTTSAFLVWSAYPVSGFAYNAESEISFIRSNAFTKSGLESDIRARSKGDLDVSVIDSANEIGVFKFGRFAAGLADDYKSGAAELGYQYESGVLSDKEANSTAFEGDLEDVSQDNYGGMFAIPTRFRDNNRGAFALSFDSQNTERIGTQGYEAANSISNSEDIPGKSNFFAGYGHRFGNFLAGIRYEEVFTDLANSSFISPLSVLTQFDNEAKRKEIVPSFAYDFNRQQMGSFIWALDVGLVDFEDNSTSTIGSAKSQVDDDVDGNLIRTGLFYQDGKALSAGISVANESLSGDRVVISGGTRLTGSTDLDELTVKMRAHYRKPKSLVGYGVSYENNSFDGVVKSPTGVTSTDLTYDTSRLEGGAAFHFNEDKALVGLEVALINESDKFRVPPPSKTKRKGHEISLGGESTVGSITTLRGGIRMKTIETDFGASVPKYDTTLNEYNLGVEVALPRQTSLIFAYAYTNTKSDGFNTVFTQDKLTYSANDIQFLVRTLFR